MISWRQVSRTQPYHKAFWWKKTRENEYSRSRGEVVFVSLFLQTPKDQDWQGKFWSSSTTKIIALHQQPSRHFCSRTFLWWAVRRPTSRNWEITAQGVICFELAQVKHWQGRLPPLPFIPFPPFWENQLDQKDKLDQRNLLDLLDQLDQRTCCTRRPVWARGPEDLSALTCPNLHNRGLFERHSHTRII